MNVFHLLPRVGLLLGLLPVAAAAADPPAADWFEQQVRPILVEHCVACHGPKKQQAGLRLDSRAGLLKGSDNGPVVSPGTPEKSPLIEAIRYDGQPRMPPKGKLPAKAVAALTAWVKQGAPWPDAAPGAAAEAATAARTHWAFQPVRAPDVPAVADRHWPANPVDHFILAALEARGLAPSPSADRHTLIRRVAFDLTGLPPTAAEVEAFLRDDRPDAYERLVDSLLASPRYGERWGRHWLDVARYADTKGYVFEEERRYPYSYTYRDYVVRAFNEDLPYDRFLVEQLAADRLPLGADTRPLAAMGFLTLGRRFLNNAQDIIDDRLDVTLRGLMGLTIGCARCHDHKFDPIPIKDYYSLYGVFASSVEPKDLPRLTSYGQSESYRAYDKELAVLEQSVTDYEEKYRAELQARNRKNRDELRRLQRKVDQLKVTHPGAPAHAMILRDAPSPVTPRVLLRGNPGNPGPEVPRQFLEVVAGPQRQPFRDGSGRLELARAIASRDNPLTARVFVNRVWLHHFGAGLVRTPSDFGLRSDPPTHPALLDYLAGRFVADGWSVKQLHRLILLSQTYRQSSSENEEARQVDPENRLLARMNRRRLDLESLRDALLAASGSLDATMGGKAVDLLTQPFTRRRTLYGFIDRQNLPGMFRTFDFASPDTSTPQRHLTTVPQQALFLLNSPFVVEQARRLTRHPETPGDVAERIQFLHRRAYARDADPEEVALGLSFVGPQPDAAAWQRYAQALLLANEFAFVD